MPIINVLKKLHTHVIFSSTHSKYWKFYKKYWDSQYFSAVTPFTANDINLWMNRWMDGWMEKDGQMTWSLDDPCWNCPQYRIVIDASEKDT